MAIPEGWSKLRDPAGSIEAAMMGDLLESYGIPVYQESLDEIPGLEKGVVVAVPTEHLRHAQEILAACRISDSELIQLAVGGPEENSDPDA